MILPDVQFGLVLLNLVTHTHTRTHTHRQTHTSQFGNITEKNFNSKSFIQPSTGWKINYTVTKNLLHTVCTWQICDTCDGVEPALTKCVCACVPCLIELQFWPKGYQNNRQVSLQFNCKLFTHKLKAFVAFLRGKYHMLNMCSHVLCVPLCCACELLVI